MGILIESLLVDQIYRSVVLTLVRLSLPFIRFKDPLGKFQLLGFHLVLTIKIMEFFATKEIALKDQNRPQCFDTVDSQLNSSGLICESCLHT